MQHSGIKDQENDSDVEKELERNAKKSKTSTNNDLSNVSSGSCEICKKRKVRCDRGKPSCKWCLNNNVHCVYKTKQKPGLKAGFGRELIDRVSLLEAQLNTQSKALLELTEQLKVSNNVSIADSNIESSTVSSEPAVSFDQPSEVIDTNTCLPNKDILVELIKLFFQRIYPHFPILHPRTTSDYLLSIINDPSNSQSDYPLLIYSIVSVTLRFIPNFRISASEKAKYYKSCKERVTLQSFSITDIEKLQALVILALDLVGMSNGPHTWTILPIICSAAVHLELSREDPQLFISSDRNKSISTQGARILPAADKWIDQESRRRLFWGVYMLDRFSSVATSFSFKISNMEIDRMLPIRKEIWEENSVEMNIDTSATRWFNSPLRSDYSMDTPNNLDAFGYTIEILQILGSIHEFLKAPVNINSLSDVVDWQIQYRQLDLMIEKWHDSLPVLLQNAKGLYGTDHHIDPMIVMLQATFHTTVIRLHSSAGYSRLRSEFFTISPSARQKCLKSVRCIVELAKQVVTFGTWQFLGPHYAWALWVSSRLLLVDCVTGHKPFPQDLELLMSSLNQCGQAWTVAARYRDMLAMVIDEELSLRSTLSEKSAQSFPGNYSSDKQKRISSARILSDMRRNAYALDLLLSKSKSPDQDIPDPEASEESDTTQSSDQDIMAVTSDLAVISEDVGDPTTVVVTPDQLANLNNIFDWFNWPKQPFQEGTTGSVMAQHSLDEFKNILSRDEIPDVEPNFQQNIHSDWLSADFRD